MVRLTKLSRPAVAVLLVVLELVGLAAVGIIGLVAYLGYATTIANVRASSDTAEKAIVLGLFAQPWLPPVVVLGTIALTVFLCVRFVVATRPQSASLLTSLSPVQVHAESDFRHPTSSDQFEVDALRRQLRATELERDDIRSAALRMERPETLRAGAPPPQGTQMTTRAESDEEPGTNLSLPQRSATLAHRIRRFVATREPHRSKLPELPDYDAFDEDYDYLDRMAAEFLHTWAQQSQDELPARFATDFIFRFQPDIAKVHTLFARAGVRDEKLDELLFGKRSALTINSAHPTTAETMLLIAERFEALAARSSQRLGPSPAPQVELSVCVTSSSGEAIDQATVVAVSLDGGVASPEKITNKLGRANLSVPKDREYTVLVSHARYSGAITNYFASAAGSLPTQLHLSDNIASLIIVRRIGYIPDLPNRLNPIYESPERKYLYADSMSINGISGPAYTFKIDEELTLEDHAGTKVLVWFRFIQGETSLIEYSWVAH